MSKRKNASGYTLIEISLSLLIMSVGLVSVMSIFPVGIKIAKETKTNASGSAAAESMFNLLSTASTTDVPYDSTLVVPSTVGTVGTPATTVSGYYFRVENKKNIAGTPPTSFTSVVRLYLYPSAAKRTADVAPYSKALASYDGVVVK